MDITKICANAQATVLNAIPEPWRINKASFTDNLDSREAVRKCGILTTEQLAITELTATELLKEMHDGKLTAVAVMEAFCARAAIAHQMVNCLTEFFPEEALEIAQSLDKVFAKTGKPVGPLHGLPIAIKDMYDVAGKRTTIGYVSWYDRISTGDASLVKVMRKSGAVVFGKTTMPQTGMALETWSNLWGRTLNPRDSRFGSGGSSGGDGALVAMKGAPCSPLSSDIGGSIRAPAAFNGLYGIRPSADRVPRGGMVSTIPGQVSIKTSCGPCAQSMPDLKLLTKTILLHEILPFESTCIPGQWIDPPKQTKLKVGVLSHDGIVTPHPPIQRALFEVTDKLRAAGHEVFEFKPAFSHWDAAETTWALYFQTGAAEIKANIAASGESTLPTYQHNCNVFKTKALTTPEMYKHNTLSAGFKATMSDAWTAAGSETSELMDVLICPSAPAAGVPHSFPIWWGYTSIWNLLDYPSVIMPMKDFKIDANKDAKDLNYKPLDDSYDRDNWEVYDPVLWTNMPVSLQYVGRPCRDEKLIADCEIIDKVINA